jgi:hypothetical protein
LKKLNYYSENGDEYSIIPEVKILDSMFCEAAISIQCPWFLRNCPAQEEGSIQTQEYMRQLSDRSPAYRCARLRGSEVGFLAHKKVQLSANYIYVLGSFCPVWRLVTIPPP